MGLVVVFYSRAEGFRAILIESVLVISLNRAVFKQVLGSLGATVDLGDNCHCLFFNF